MSSSDRDTRADRLREVLREHERRREELVRPGEGSTLGRFTLIRRLGEGGAGQVWLAEDPTLRREVALKLLTGLREGDLERFLREGRLAAKLSHPHIVQIFDMGFENGRAYISMQYINAPSAERRKFEARRAAAVMADVADAVHYAHGAGVIHRDIKPGNIFVSDDGRAALGDFGLAKQVDSSDTVLTRSGSIMGTPAYMSPEQAQGKVRHVGPASDVYSLGATLYALLCGRDPFEGKTLLETLEHVVSAEPAPLQQLDGSIPAELNTIAHRAMAKEPELRYPTAGAFSADLRRFLNGEPIEARPTSWRVRLFRRVRRNPVLYALILAAAAAGSMALGFGAAAKKEREASLQSLRDTARISVDAALKLRRAGANAGMKDFFPSLEEAYRKASDRAPDFAEVDYLMGRMYRALMDFDRSMKFQSAALSKDPEFAPARYERVVLNSIRFRQRFADERRQLLVSEDRTISPSEELAALDREIVKDCEELEKFGDRLPPVYREVARAIREGRKGEDENALKRLDDALRREPRMEEAWEEKAWLYVVRAWSERNAENRERAWKSAQESYDQAITHDRGYIRHWIGRGTLSYTRGLYAWTRGEDPGSEFNAAVADFSEALRLDPGHVDSRAWRGGVQGMRARLLLQSTEDPLTECDAAERDFNAFLASSEGRSDLRLEALRGRGIVRMIRATHLANRGLDPFEAFAQAEKDFRESSNLSFPVAARTYVARIHRDRGKHRERLGQDPLPDYAEAERECSQAVTSSPSVPSAWSGRALVRLFRALYVKDRHGDATDLIAAAEEDAKEALRVAPADSEAGLTWALVSHYRAAWTPDPLLAFAESDRRVTEILTRDPKNAEALMVRGVIRSSRAIHRKSGEDFAQAERDFAEFLKLRPNHAEVYWRLGELRWHKAVQSGSRADYKQAAESFELSIGLNPLYKSAIGTKLTESRAKSGP